jgi:hypothetical protein
MRDLSLDVQHLKRSVQYQVCRTFTDYYSNPCRAGEVLTFVEYHFLPYHGGYTLVFQERSLYFQEEENADILNSLGTYFREVDK